MQGAVEEVDQRVQGSMVIIGRTATLPPRRGRICHLLFQDLHEARLANPCLTTQRDAVAHAVLDLAPTIEEQGHFGFSTDQRRETSTARRLAVNEFVSEVFQGRVIELELPLEGAIGHPATPLEQGNRLSSTSAKVIPRPPAGRGRYSPQPWMDLLLRLAILADFRLWREGRACQTPRRTS